jgi:hypothetical protein
MSSTTPISSDELSDPTVFGVLRSIPRAHIDPVGFCETPLPDPVIWFEGRVGGHLVASLASFPMPAGRPDPLLFRNEADAKLAWYAAAFSRPGDSYESALLRAAAFDAAPIGSA